MYLRPRVDVCCIKPRGSWICSPWDELNIYNHLSTFLPDELLKKDVSLNDPSHILYRLRTYTCISSLSFCGFLDVRFQSMVCHWYVWLPEAPRVTQPPRLERWRMYPTIHLADRAWDRPSGYTHITSPRRGTRASKKLSRCAAFITFLF